MRLHYLAGDRSAALLAFGHCERVLKHEVGARPSAATLALLANIEQAQAPLAVVPAGRAVPAAVPLRPLVLAEVVELLDSLGIDGLAGEHAAPALLQRSAVNAALLAAAARR